MANLSDARFGYGLSRAERREQAAALRDGRIEPSDALKTMLQELKTRKTAKAVSHFQASILNEKMSHAGQVNLHLLSQRIPPHERLYLFEISEERKAILSRSPHLERVASATFDDREDEQSSRRAFGKAPRESRSFQEFMSNIGRIERRLLNEAVSRMNPEDDREPNDLSITDARNRLPEKMRDEIRLRARDQAWQSLVPTEIFDRNPSPEALRISETIAHIQEHLQDRARIGQTARNDFVTEKVAVAERTKTEREVKQELAEERREFVQEAAALGKCSYNTIWRAVANGKLRATAIGNQPRIIGAELLKWIEGGGATGRSKATM